MPERASFDYAIVRIVPHVEREEFINVGVIVFCRTKRFLDARIKLDEQRLTALCPKVNVEAVKEHLALIPTTCAGGDDAGPIGQLLQAERFHWLVSPRSTVIQVSPVHCGLCGDPAAALDDLYARLVERSS